nr:MAG TPA: hypothetical protein [Caudoviricetes sp.]
MIFSFKTRDFLYFLAKLSDNYSAKVLCLCMERHCFSYPPYQFLRKYASRGAAVSGRLIFRDSDCPSPCGNSPIIS